MSPFTSHSVADMSVEDLIAREQIRDCLMRYSRGVDRCDFELINSAYWPDATDLHAMPGRPPMNAHAMFVKLRPKLLSMDQTMHTLGNIFIRVSGAVAFAESYFHAYHRVVEEGQPRDIVTAGRYIDELSRRDKEWRIQNRVVTIDWFREYDDSADWTKGTFGGPCLMGARMPDDESYRMLDRLGVTS